MIRILLYVTIMLGIFMSMMMASFKNKGIVTANVTSHGPLYHYVSGLRPQSVLGVQGHHVGIARLGEYQEKLQDAGWRELRAPAAATAAVHGVADHRC